MIVTMIQTKDIYFYNSCNNAARHLNYIVSNDSAVYIYFCNSFDNALRKLDCAASDIR
jgi:hypothetical protein